MKELKVLNRKRAKREQRGLISEFAFEREQQRDETWVLRPRARGLRYGNLDEDARFRDRRSVLAHGRGDLGAGRARPWASILPATPRDLLAKGDLLRNGPFFWDSFTLDRIRNAVVLYRSRGIFRPLRASDMDEPHPDAVPDQRERVRPRKDKGIALEDKNFVSKIFRYPDGTRVSPRVMEVEPTRLPFRTTSLPTFLPKKGRRAIAAELARRATLFDAEFRSFKDAQDYAGDFRECRGSVGTLWKSQNADFSFLSQVTEMSGLMDGCAQAESMVPPIEGRIRELWEPIEVSEDTTEAGADAADKGGEVDQPADSFGASISGYELGMDLSPDEFEGLWSTRKTSIDYSYRMAPKRHMSIIQGHTSKAKGWFERFFYVRIDSASVEENCLPLFRGKWNFHRANSILPAIPRDLFAKCDLLRNGPFFWDSFTLDRIRNAVAYRSRGISRPLRASDMDEPHPDAVPDQRERVRPRKDKGIALEYRNLVSEDLPLLGWNPGFTPGDGSGTSEAPLPDDFFANLPPGFTTPASLDEASRREVVAEGSRLINEGRRVFNSTLHGSFREARLSHFKAEEIKRKFIRFQNEFAERERRQAESHSRALIRAERKGRRTITAELAGELHCLMLSSGASRMLKTMWVTSANVAVRLAESMVPPIEGRIRELWKPIEVSEDTTEAGADAADEGGEVDQPGDSFGALISCYLDLDL
ncbi:hypothetical protein F2Q70_00001564 [Brassica cretica]|uniref:Uncharacterized protein n=1 Tax=Brassica cretica TaxID=69181 RepID=A0A8S9IN85_BRACR|nr:hypothetical protein F2Q70_00001564 [Brassica cretica]